MDFINLYLINEKLPAMKKKLLLLNVLILVALTTFAQNGFTSYPLTTTASNTRNCLKIDASGNKWIGFSNRGATKFDGVSCTIYDTLNSGIAANWVYDIAFGAGNTIWFATKKGLSKFDGTNWTTYKKINSGLPSDTVLTLFVDNTDVWIGTQNGLSKFNGSTWAVYNMANSGLINNKVLCINKDASNKMWIGTPVGLSVKSGTSWITYNENNSYFVRDQVNAIYTDNSIVWVGTENSGLFKFENNVFQPLLSLFYNTIFNSTSIYNISTISKGPQGGVMINSFFEILPDQVHQYTLPSGLSSSFHACDPTTGFAWFIKYSGIGTSNIISSFNYQNYTGITLLSNIPQSCNTLDVNEVRASLMNRGDMFWSVFGSINGARYEVPKNSGRHSTFANALWVGGIDNGGTLHEAAMTYRQTGSDYWPGPLDTLSGNEDSITSALYDKIWKIDRLNIEEFKINFASGAVQNGTYIVSNDILTWPAIGTGNFTRNMAPFVDVNSDGIYSPLTDGDYPKITGDQMCYWIFNDNMTHGETGAPPLKVEIHASAYAFTCPQITDSLRALNYTTFYNYEIYNRSSTNYTNTYLGNWDDADLGFYLDDFIGCTPNNNYGFMYNGYFSDGSGQLGAYGEKPPMISTVVLNGPLAEPNDSLDNNNNGVIDEAGEKNLMTSFIYIDNNSDPINGNPNVVSDYYNYSRGKWRDSTRITYGGNGIGGSIPTNFIYDGALSGAGWTDNPPASDRRFVIGCGPFNLNTGQHVNFSYALVWTRDTASAYTITNLYNKNLADVKKVQQWYAADNYPSCYDLQAGVNSVQENSNSFTLYPNPANTQITIAYKAETKNARIELFNATGQKINSFVYFNQLQTIDISGFPNGLYLIKITDGKNSSVQRFVKN